jgi:hypothetical protein
MGELEKKKLFVKKAYINCILDKTNYLKQKILEMVTCLKGFCL